MGVAMETSHIFEENYYLWRSPQIFWGLYTYIFLKITLRFSASWWYQLPYIWPVAHGLILCFSYKPLCVDISSAVTRMHGTMCNATHDWVCMWHISWSSLWLLENKSKRGQKIDSKPNANLLSTIRPSDSCQKIEVVMITLNNSTCVPYT